MKAVYGAIAAGVLGATMIVGVAHFVDPSTEPSDSATAEPSDGTAATPDIASQAESSEIDDVTAATFVEFLSVRELLTYPVHGTAKRASLATLVAETGVQIGAPVTIDEAEVRRLGVDFQRQVSFAAPREAGGTRLHALLRLADPSAKLKLAVQLDRRMQIGFIITSADEAERRLLTLVPRNLLESSGLPVPQVPAVAPSVAKSQPKTPAKVALASTEDLVVKRQREFAESFEGRLYQLAQRMGMKLRIDWDSIRRRDINTANRLRSFQFEGFAPSGRPAIEEVQLLLDKNSSYLAYTIVRDPTEGDTLVITTVQILAAFGGRPTLKMFYELSPHHNVFEVQPPSVGMLTLAQGFKQPIEGLAREMSLFDALTELAKQAGLAVKIEAVELETVGVLIETRVMFEPRRREARAVLYDILYQVDAERSGRVVYCYEKLGDGTFRFVVTTREAALKERRTIPSDLSFEPDDI